jgi:hypothetical protein
MLQNLHTTNLNTIHQHFHILFTMPKNNTLPGGKKKKKNTLLPQIFSIAICQNINIILFIFIFTHYICVNLVVYPFIFNFVLSPPHKLQIKIQHIYLYIFVRTTWSSISNIKMKEKKGLE